MLRALGARKYEQNEQALQLYTKCGKSDGSEVLREASDILNDIIHSEVPKHLSHDLKLSLHDFNIERQITNINPLIVDVHQVYDSYHETKSRSPR